MVDVLEKQINEYFAKPVDGRKLITSLEISKDGVKKVNREPDPTLVDIAAGFGSGWLDVDVFFDAIMHFTGAKEVKWGPPLARDNRTDGEIHKCLVVDGKFYEYRGNWYERDSAKTFVKELVEGKVKPYEY